MLTGPPPKFHGARDILGKWMAAKRIGYLAIPCVGCLAYLESPPKHITR